MERNAVRLFLRLSRVLLGLLVVQTMIAQTPEANISAEKEVPMARDASPDFLVATIKPGNPDSTGGWAFPTEGRHISCVNATVATIMVVAYGIHAKQIVGGPEWLSKDRYDINGIPDVPGVPDLKQMQEMYRKLLANRFHLIFHREIRDIPIYALTRFERRPNPQACRSQRKPQYREFGQWRSADSKVHQHVHTGLRAQHELLRGSTGHRSNLSPGQIRFHP